MVAEAHLGKPVRCGKCQRVFTPPAPTSVEELDDCLPTFDDPLPAGQRLLAGPAPRPRLDVGAATSPGRVRERNEDSFLVQSVVWSNLAERHDLTLLVVADGMGGYDAGDRASELVIQTLAASLGPLLTGGLSSKLSDTNALMSALIDSLRSANRVVLQKGQTDRNCKGMGATVATALIWDDSVCVAHVGDARVYHQTGGRLKQITKDQTLVARMVEMGTLSEREALIHPRRNEVAQAIGKQPDLTPGEYRLTLARGDWLLVACDGLHAHIEADELESMIRAASASASVLATQLVDEVDRRGGTDNTTILAVRCY